MSVSNRLSWLAMLSIAASAASPLAAAASPQATQSNISELRLDASLIQEFLQVIYFNDGGRHQFREYSMCSYEFLQNPSVAVEGGLVRISAEYYRRRGTEGLGGCVGGPGVNTMVSMSARLSGRGRTVTIEVLEVTTETMPELTSIILGLAGVTLPMTQDFDLMAAMNNVLYGQQPFGVSSLDIHEVLTEDNSVLVRLTMQLGIW